MKVRLRQCVLWCQRLWRSVRPLRVALVFVLLGAMTSVAVAWAIAWHGHERFGRLSDARRNSETFEDWIKERPTSWFRSRWVKDLDNGPRPLREGAEAELVWVANVDMIDRVGFPLHAMSVETRARGSIYAPSGFSNGVLIRTQTPLWITSEVLLPLKVDLLAFPINACAWGGVWAVGYFAARRVWRSDRIGMARLQNRLIFAGAVRVLWCAVRPMAFLACGFVLSVGSAWWCSSRAEISLIRDYSVREAKSGEITAACAEWVYAGLSFTEPGRMEVLEYSFFGQRERLYTYVSDGEKNGTRGGVQLTTLQAILLSGDKASWWVHEFGFPLPCMYFESPFRTRGTRRLIAQESGPRFSASIRFNQRAWLIPLQFNVWPTVLNSVVFGTLVWLLWTGFTRVLSRFKPEPGTCLFCGYDARGLVRCPECGGEMKIEPVAGEVAAAANLAGRG